MDTNGTYHGSDEGAERDPAVTTFPAASAFIWHLIQERPELGKHRDALYELAGMAAGFGYAQAQEEFRAGTLPVRFTEGAIGIATLEGDEAAELLKSFGLSTEGE